MATDPSMSPDYWEIPEDMDPEDFYWLEGLVSKLRNSPRHHAYILNTPRYNKAVKAIVGIKKLFSDYKITVNTDEEYPLWIGVEVNGQVVGITDGPAFQEILDNTDCYDSWSKLDGTVVMAFTFNNIQIPIDEAT